MSELSDFEQEAERAVRALRIAVAYLSADDYEQGDGIASPQAVVVCEGLAAAERVLGYLNSLRRPGDGASAAYPGWSYDWQDWCPHHVPRMTGGFRVRRQGHGDPGE